jgi:hypothetical protein
MENSTAKGLSKEISELIVRRNMKCLDNTKLNFLSNQVAVKFNVFCSFVVHMISSYMDGCLAVTVKEISLWMRNK